MGRKAKNRKGNAYLKKATGSAAARMIAQGNVRGAARIIGHYADPENPVAAGKKMLSNKVLSRAKLIYTDQMKNKKGSGRAAAKQIARARRKADILRFTEDWKQNNSHEIMRRVVNKSMTRSLKNANALIEGGKVARTAARGAGVFGIAAMVAQHLAGEMRKKKV
jgi:hypothetical protein